jgi:hypothetical protein
LSGFNPQVLLENCTVLQRIKSNRISRTCEEISRRLSSHSSRNREGIKKHRLQGELRLLSHGAKSLHQENAVNGFSQCQCWRLVLLDQADLSRFTQRMVEYLIVVNIIAQLLCFSQGF